MLLCVCVTCVCAKKVPKSFNIIHKERGGEWGEEWRSVSCIK
jgi:hypothetical protein